MKKIVEWVEYNRFLVIGIMLSACLAFYAASCTPQVTSPLDSAKIVDARGLELELKTWESQQSLMTAKFESAGQDLQEQIENQKKIDKLLGDIAANATNPASWPGLLLTGGGLGAIIDNIRKRGVISGLKRNA